jgi:hypothetical protein
LQRRETDSPPPVQLWRALSADQAPPPDWLPALRDWLADAGSALDDPLALLAAAESWSKDPDCVDCRRQLQRQLWPLQPLPIAAPASRTPTDAVGASYLRRLDRTEADPAETAQ